MKRRNTATAASEDTHQVVRQLRQLASDFDALNFIIEGSFDTYGDEVETVARRARPVMREAANTLFQLLEVIEKKATPP